MSLLSKLFGRGEMKAPATPKPAFNGTQGTFEVAETFSLPGKGDIITGKVMDGGIAVGFQAQHAGMIIEVVGIEMFNKQEGSVVAGDMAGLLVSSGTAEGVTSGTVLTFVNTL